MSWVHTYSACASFWTSARRSRIALAAAAAPTTANGAAPVVSTSTAWRDQSRRARTSPAAISSTMRVAMHGTSLANAAATALSDVRRNAHR